MRSTAFVRFTATALYTFRKCTFAAVTKLNAIKHTLAADTASLLLLQLLPAAIGTARVAQKRRQFRMQTQTRKHGVEVEPPSVQKQHRVLSAEFRTTPTSDRQS